MLALFMTWNEMHPVCSVKKSSVRKGIQPLKPCQNGIYKQDGDL